MDRADPVGSSHAFVDHVSELTLRLRAPSLPALLAEASRAFLALVPEGRRGAPVDEPRVLEVTGTDRAALLVAWLNELVYLGEVEGWLPTSLDMETRDEDEGIRVRARGVALAEPFVLVKAATLHQATVADVEGGLEAEVTLDV